MIQDGGQFDYLGENISRSKTDIKIFVIDFYIYYFRVSFK